MVKLSFAGIFLILIAIVILPMVTASGSAGDYTGPGNSGNRVVLPQEISFGVIPVKPMVGGQITFIMQGTYPPGTWFYWDFGDGGSTRTQAASVEYLYKKTGIYRVTVAVNSESVAERFLDLTLKKGDILVHKSDSAISYLIPGPWSHAGIYIGNDTVLESTSEGVHESLLYPAWSYPADTCVAAFRLPAPDDTTRENIVRWALGKKGASYDYLSIITPPFGLKQADCQDINLKPNCNNYYCSELVWAAYYRNGIDLYQKLFLVLPSALVNARYYSTDLVGAHIEKIPDSGSGYAGYFRQVLAGNNPPYNTTSSSGNAGYALVLVGVNSGQGNNVVPGSVEMTLQDPSGRELSGTHNTVPDSAVEKIDYDADGYSNDQLAGLSNPDPGEYTLRLALSGPPSGQDRIDLKVGSWDDDQYSRISPMINVSTTSGPEVVHFRIDEKDLTRVITIPARGAAPLNVTFIVLSRLEHFKDSWDFGDGTMTEDNQTVSHLYTVPGTYMVRVTDRNTTASSTVTIPVIVEANPVSLKADFIIDRTSGTAPLTVKCTDQSIGKPSFYNYDFGDGTNVTGPNPTHTYLFPGNYTITLSTMKYNTTTYSIMSSVATKPNAVTVRGVPRAPLKAEFAGSPVSGQAPLTVTFTDQSSGSPTYLNYNFGDGFNATGKNPVHIYRFPGVYNVTLSIYKFDSTSGSMRSDVVVKKDLVEVTRLPVPQTPVICNQPYGLCTIAKCRPLESDPTKAVCTCLLEDGVSLGMTSCSERQPVNLYHSAKGEWMIVAGARMGQFTSTYSFINSMPKEEGMIPNRYIDPNYTGNIILKYCDAPLWANCLDMKCTVPPANPHDDMSVDHKAADYATCECAMVRDTHEYYMATPGGEASCNDTGLCQQNIWSAAYIESMTSGIASLKAYLAAHPNQDPSQQYAMPICESCVNRT